MTSYQIIFDSFLAKIEEDQYCNEGADMTAIYCDMEALMESALPWFKLPKCSLERHANSFDGNGGLIIGYYEDDLNSQEIDIIATLMKREWLKRTINTWQNVRVMYDERDFSQANLLNNFVKLLEYTDKECWRLQKLYSRSIEDDQGNRTTYPFGNWVSNNGQQ